MLGERLGIDSLINGGCGNHRMTVKQMPVMMARKMMVNYGSVISGLLMMHWVLVVIL